MVHLTNTLRSATFLLGTAMLMLFLFCAPMHAQTPTFKSTSSYRIANPNYSAQQLDPTTIGHQAYRSTIYDPFGNQTPSSGGGGNPAHNDGNGSGEDVGIPDWGDTMSEPLPITDGTLFLLLIAATMITIIAIKQRKQKQLQSITTNNNNNPTQHMTTRKQTYQSFFQKLFLLLAFVCIAGQVSAKYVYFRPSTILVGPSGTAAKDATAWAKSSSDCWFPMLRVSNYASTSRTKHMNHYKDTYISNAIYAETQSRFLRYTVSSNTDGFAFYRVNDLNGSITEAVTEGYWTVNDNSLGSNSGVYDCVPNNKWWTQSETYYKSMFTLGNIGADHNLIGMYEGTWGTEWEGYYLAFYVENDVHLYFANNNNWTTPMFARGKDVYSYKETTTKINGTNLYYTYLKANNNIAYRKYAYIDDSTGSWTEIEDLWKKYKTTVATQATIDANKLDTRLGGFTKRSKAIDDHRLDDTSKGTTHLFIPSSTSNNPALTKSAHTSYTALNYTLTVQTYSAKKANVGSNIDYSNNTDGGTIKYSAYKLSGQGTSVLTEKSSSTASTDITAAYTGTIVLTAVPKPGYKFVGWYSSTGDLLDTDLEWTTEKTKGNTTIHARFLAIEKRVRMQTFGWYPDPDDNNVEKYMWRQVADGGEKITITYNDGTGQKTTEKFDAPPTPILSPEGNEIILEATPNTGYTFIGWWNNGSNYDANPWEFLPEETNQSITARFAKCYNQTISKTCYDPATKTYTETNEGGNIQIDYDDGFQQHSAEVSPSTNSYRTIEQSICTLTVTPKDGYKFLGWYEEGSSEPLTTNDEYTYKATSSRNISARFVQIINQTIAANPANGNGGTFDASYIHNNVEYSYNNKVSYGPFEIHTNEDITVTANPKTGYTFVGWYYNGEFKSSDLTYTYQPSIDGATMTANFVLANAEHAIALLTYDPTYNEYKPVNPGGSVTYTTKKANGLNLEAVNGTTETATTFTAASGQNVTLSAQAKTDYDFIGFYEGDILLAEGGAEAKAYTYEYTATSEGSHITARFAPKNSLKITLVPNSAGTYIAKYGYNQTTLYAKESSLTDEVITYAPMNMIYGVSSVKPILGYKFVEMYPNGNIKYKYSLGQYSGKQEADRKIVVNFVRYEDQEVYLALNDEWDHTNQKYYYVYATNVANSETAWFKMTSVDDGRLYKYTIPRNTYSHIAFAQGSSKPTGKLTDYTGNKTKLFTIPATRYNCMKLKSAYNSSIGGKEDMWSEPPTQEGDFRLVYIEQTVTDKNNITVDYTFDNAGLIKKKANNFDTISLHIYNKVSDNINGINNPEIILQRCCTVVDGKSQWEEVERRMVFGPLRATDEGVIRMPGRRNAATTTTIVYDNGIDKIKNYGDDQHKGSGVWNFVISQDNAGNATILADATKRYKGDYYIRTTNADGQYYQYTHPGNVMKLSEYAAANSDYSHYFIRYVDINEDGKATAESGKHPVIKFAIANDYSVYLNKEFMMTEERFKDDEYGVDKFVVDKGGAPNLPADASVRFGWDSVTNRLTRAYIANTTIKNNEYLVIEGENIGDATYFTDNSNWLYTIDLNATKDADTDVKAKVKAKMNGQYQYFMGSESENETLISGNSEGSYPIRLLYDFKDDRFTTIYHPQGTISGTTNLQTPVMIEREHNNAPTQITFETSATIKATGTGEDQYTQPAYAVMTFLGNILTDPAITHHEKMFYWVSFPFDVKISEVFGLGKYGKYWIMQEYDGKQRDDYGLKYTNWKYITTTGTILKANIGYVICLNYSQLVTDGIATKDNKISLYFPSNSVVSSADIEQQNDVTVTLDSYTSNKAWYHNNWHLIGVPSFATPGLTRQNTGTTFLYEYWHPGDAYAAIANEGPKTFLPMHSYMVQYAGDITWTSVVNTPKSLAAKTSAEDKPVMLRLELQQAGSTIDKTFVQLRNDKGTLGFDLNLDLSKIINAGSNIYSVVSGDQMAGNAIPKEESIIPIGVVITAAGEYTFAMPNGTEGMIVELIDYEQGTSTNLLMSDYTITLNKGTFNQRFALRLKPDKVATSVDNIGNGANGDEVRKLLIDGVLYLQKGNNTYDAQGKHVQ